MTNVIVQMMQKVSLFPVIFAAKIFLYFSILAHFVTFYLFSRGAESTLYRTKRRGQPKMAKTPDELHEYLALPEAASYRQHLQARVHIENNETQESETGFIFAAESIRPYLSEVKVLNFDGTFYVTPTMFRQLFTLMGEVRGTCFPLVHILMTHKTKSLYCAVMQKVADLFPELMPEKAMGDFEDASRDAIRLTYPAVQLGGCQFHYAKRVWARAQKIGLQTAFSDSKVKRIIKSSMAIPFLPAPVMVNTAEMIFAEIQDVENIGTRQKCHKLAAYIRRFWLGVIQPESLSVFDFTQSTNNSQEGYHAQLKATIRTHRPNVWSFLKHLNGIISDYNNDLARLENGLQIRKKGKAKFQRNMLKRQLCKERLSAGLYSPIEYIRAIQHSFDSDLISSHVSESDEESEDEATPPAVGAGANVGAPGGNNICIVCLAPREGTFLFRPCRHALTCGPCSSRIMEDGTEENPAKCPYCRSVIAEREEIFVN